MTELKDQVLDLKNIYLAYIRVKNALSNEELLIPQEIKYFEKNLEDNLNLIQDDINNNTQYQKYYFYLKPKKFIIRSNDKVALQYRPLIVIPLKDHIRMMSVMNIVVEQLKNFLPKENYGVQLDDFDKRNLYKPWLTQYKSFVSEQRKCLGPKTIYRAVYEYDLTQFYPSIQQQNLINLLDDLLSDSWLKERLNEIIYYYNVHNVADITRKDLNYYVSRNKKIYKYKNIADIDLGLPQGPLFSSFLSSLYTKDLYKQVKKELAQKTGINISDNNIKYFAYVDDGRIYMPENPSQKILNETLKNCLDKLNNSAINNKKIKINNDKTSVLDIYKKSVTNILDKMSENISLINKSINPNYEIEEDEYKQVQFDHSVFLKKIDEIQSFLLDSNHDNDEAVKAQLNKINKELNTYIKRRATFLTKKVSSDEKYFDIVKRLFNIKTFTTDNFKYFISKNTESELYNINIQLTDFNFYYNLLNLLESANKDSNKYLFLANRCIEVLDYYAKIKPKIDLTYYVICIIRAVYQFEYNEILQDFISNAVNIPVINKKLVLNYQLSYFKQSWFKNVNAKFSQIWRKSANSLLAGDALQFYNKKILDYDLVPDVFLECLEKPKALNDTFYVHYGSCLYKNDSTEIYLYNIVRSGKEEQRLYKYNKIYSSYLTEYNRIKILKTLSSFWREEFGKKNYIELGYLSAENFVLKVDDTSIRLGVAKTSNQIFEYHCDNNLIVDYRKYFLEFFCSFFHCTDKSFLVHENAQPLRFWEYRIFSFLVYKSFNLNDFFEVLNDSLENTDYYGHDVDGNFERIRRIVDLELKTAKQKDIILLLHYYVHCLWKNGSKDLPFFTLHNEEHSIELIKNYVQISKKCFNHLSLTYREKFLMFCACYLHDIGMLKGLTEEERFDIYNKGIINFYNDVLKAIKQLDKAFKPESVLAGAYGIYEKFEVVNEGIVRGKHAQRSYDEIQKDNKSLPLTDLEKFIIAKVSYNHGVDVSDVYGKKETVYYQGSKVNIRKMSMWLRLLDLTDVTKYRVTQDVFNRYFERMGTTSRYHWVKHLAVDAISFEIQPNKEEKDDLVLQIKILFNYLPPEEQIRKKCLHNCKFCYERNTFEKENTNTKKFKYPYYCNLRNEFINEFKWFEVEAEAINTLEKSWQDNFRLEMKYELIKTPRENFVVYEDYEHHHKITATDCIKEYILNK